MAVYRVQDTSLTAVADAIRAKAGTSGALTFPDGFVEAVGGIQAGGGGAAGVSPKEVNFYDYDGTLLHAYTVEEARRMAELPAGPTHKGLVFQGWNWSLEGVKGLTRAMNIGAMYTTDDGTTRLYITLQEGRTSPMLGVGVNGTVTVDWGDGTEQDVLTGKNIGTAQWTPNHAYAAPGDYVIRLTVDGEMAFSGSLSSNQGPYVLRFNSGADNRNATYRNALKKVEGGQGLSSILANAFASCRCLENITIPEGIVTLGTYAFQNCYRISAITMPSGVTDLGAYVFAMCYTLASISFPEGMKTFSGGSSLSNCNAKGLTIPDSVTSVNASFQSNTSIVSVIMPKYIADIGAYAFNSCYGVACYDFTACTAVPTLANINAFSGIPDDCEIRVPAALYDEWIAATNWATYASQIKAY